MRYVIHGAGAIGSAIGAELLQAGFDVSLVARGAHFEALRDNGLTISAATGERTLSVACYDDAAKVPFAPDDVVFLTVKSQDSAAALRQLSLVAPAGVTIVCAQNGVANEPLALRSFDRVLAMLVMVPAMMRAPGIVENPCYPSRGILDLGALAQTTDTVASAIAQDLTQAGFSSRVVPDIMAWKYAKLLDNLRTVVAAITPRSAEQDDLYADARREAGAVYARADIRSVSEADLKARRLEANTYQPYADSNRGGSAWQSLARGTGSVEADYLAGEIVYLGRLHGVETPVNGTLQRLANIMAMLRLPPASLSVEQVRLAIEASRAGRDLPLPDHWTRLSQARNPT